MVGGSGPKPSSGDVDESASAGPRSPRICHRPGVLDGRVEGRGMLKAALQTTLQDGAVHSPALRKHRTRAVPYAVWPGRRS